MKRPGRPPYAGTLRRTNPRPLDWLVAQHQRHGDVFTAQIDRARTVVCGGAGGLAAFFAAERQHFTVYNTPLVHDLFGRSVFNLPRSEHTTARRLLGHGLAGDVLRGCTTDVLAVVDEHCTSWRHRPDFDLHKAARHLTMDVCSLVLASIGARTAGHDAMTRAFESFTAGTEVRSPSRYALVTYWRARRARSVLRGLCSERMAGGVSARPDVLAVIAEHGAQRGYSLDDVPDHFLALLIAGRETTASLIVWLLVELALAPDLAAVLAHEARTLMADPAAALARGAAPSLRAALTETERLHSPNSLAMRRVVDDVELCGYLVPRGWRAAYSPAANHLMADIYRRPRCFVADRFTGPAGPPMASRLLTFGRGQHRCPGQNLAEMVTLLVAAVVISNGRLVLLDGCPRAGEYFPVKVPASPLRARIIDGEAS